MGIFKFLIYSKRGFTIVEMLVIFAVSVFLTSLLILYSRTGERQIILLREQAKIVNTVLRAKALAVQTFNQAADICGYGVHFEQKSFILFRDAAKDCSASDNRYSGSGEDFQKFDLDPALKIQSPISDILFIPPDPRVLLIPDQTEAVLTIAAEDEKSALKIKVNNAGQITTQ
jgi:hypothetical protein